MAENPNLHSPTVSCTMQLFICFVIDRARARRLLPSIARLEFALLRLAQLWWDLADVALHEPAHVFPLRTQLHPALVWHSFLHTTRRPEPRRMELCIRNGPNFFRQIGSTTMLQQSTLRLTTHS